MATLVLSAVGAAVGANIGGSVLGLSGMVIGRAVGATLGRVIDQRLLGQGSQAVSHGGIDRLQVTGAGESVPLPLVWGRMKLAGHVIWASAFEEHPGPAARGKGAAAPGPGNRYTVSLALALCEGPVTGLGRVWANGEEIAQDALNLRLHRGDEGQGPDPKIEAVEGAGMAPAYRGTAYVVLEDIDLAPWGNRIPSLSFEVLAGARAPGQITLQQAVRAVAWMPGSGEYALATEPVLLSAPGDLPDEARMANVNTPSGRPDFPAALDALAQELPGVASGLLIVSWFGDDLRCDQCTIRPKVEFAERDGIGQPWRAGGIDRADAQVLPRREGAPVYGGTPSDASVLQAIAAMKDAGQGVVYYPFILMDQTEGNARPDPWSDAPDQPVLPWRGRITLSIAPGREGSPDGTAAAAAQVAAFFGTAAPGHFAVNGGQVHYSGPDEWCYRRFILHQAALCLAAGGVDAFCIGSEMVALMRIRDDQGGFPAVQAMRALLHDVRALLGPDVKLTYAADWSEYAGFGDDAGSRYFHLDALWSDPDCDVIGIDNYMPLSDWREGEDHADARAGWRALHDPAYLRANIAGGEGFDWYYPDDHARLHQQRAPITDGAHGEPWVWRYKDLRAWWENPHHERHDGERQAEPTGWVPRSKPVWFTELGCPAVDKGTNQPNVFFDPKSSESALPYFSDGGRDDLIQMQYLRVLAEYWADPAANPVSDVYGGPMVDWSRAHVWAWDARPWPWFPANGELWADGGNWLRGHWLSGRAMNQPLAAVVAEICHRAGVAACDVSDLRGLVRGYAQPSTESGRAMLQPLMLAHGFEAIERDGVLVFRMRDGRNVADLDPQWLALREGGEVETRRAAPAEAAARVRLSHIEAEADFETRSTEAVHPDDPAGPALRSELPLLLTPAEARRTVRRWLAEARVAQDTARFSLPPSSPLGVGDVVALPAAGGRALYRIDRIDLTGAREVEAVRTEPGVYRTGDPSGDALPARRFEAPVPVLPVFLDLPLMRGDEVAHAPHLAVSARPWPGAVAVHDAAGTDGFVFNRLLGTRAAIGRTLGTLPRRGSTLWQRGEGVLVQFPDFVSLMTQDAGAVLAGANLAAIGDGAEWELFQFARAEPVEPGVWRLSQLLRGRFGTDALVPDAWMPGATVVRVDPALVQIDLALALRGVARRYRIGPAALQLDDPRHVERVEAFAGNGLRPYAPVFLRAGRAGPEAPLQARWIRRTRLGGEDWDGIEVPLAEESEHYLVRVEQGGTVRRTELAGSPEWTYPPEAQLADGVTGSFDIAVAQVSALYGPGPFARCTVSG